MVFGRVSQCQRHHLSALQSARGSRQQHLELHPHVARQGVSHEANPVLDSLDQRVRTVCANVLNRRLRQRADADATLA